MDTSRNANELRAIGNRLLQWHGGQGDPIYAVGSFYSSGKEYPDKEVIERAATVLEKLAGAADRPRDRRELNMLAKYLGKKATS